jgi:hypothetical protein
MKEKAPPLLSRAMTWAAVAITAVLLVLGIAWYGLSWEVHERFWTALLDPTQPRGRLREGLMSTSQMALIGLAMDMVYQFKVFDRFYPVEAAMMVLLLAVLPYFVLRGLVEHVAREQPVRRPLRVRGRHHP